MTDRIVEWLDESQQLADKATEGPWEVYGYNVLAHLGPGNCNGSSRTYPGPWHELTLTIGSNRIRFDQTAQWEPA